MKPETLEAIGLTHNESITYLALLSLGTSKTGEILKTAKLNSGKIYEILEGLKDKGLASESIINKVRHFTASSPTKILEYLEKKRETVNKEENLIKSELNSLESLRNAAIKETKAVTYTGFRGFKTAVQEALSTLKEDDEILGMGITSRKEGKFNDFWLSFGKERVKKKIRAKNLFSEKSDFMQEYEKINLTENRILEGITPVTVDIFGKDKVLILNYNHPISCTLIYDENTATSFRNFFNQLWKIAKK